MVANNNRRNVKNNVNGLILAGGRARRMGGQDKGLILLDGKHMVEHCIARLLPQVGQIFISANKNIAQYGNYGFSVLEDTFGHFEGPLAGLLRAFEYSKDIPVLVVPCDAPFLSPALAIRLLQSYKETKASAVIPHDGNRLQPLFGLYAPDVVSSLTKYLASGQRKVETWITTLPYAVVDFSNEKESFMNINTESDLEVAQSILHPAMDEEAPHAE
jgi:molybdenum cofactor guanylyltransferase